ncbi:hypothetical protein P609_02955 [Comamonas thiooxydans]|nr:hypothetical protein P609_02955 [Comamonas thiooxydans]
MRPNDAVAGINRDGQFQALGKRNSDVTEILPIILRTSLQLTVTCVRSKGFL